MTVRSYFDKELEALKSDVIKMGALIEDSLARCISTLKTGSKATAMGVVADDKDIDALEKVIESRCLKLLMRQQPVAGDLRTISTAIKMITDMERIGDQAADICDICIHTGKMDLELISKNLMPMASAAAEMVKDSIDSFIRDDLELANKTIEKDDIVDNYFEKVKSDLVASIHQKEEIADSSIDVLMIAKYFERIGDHAVNICEWVDFHKTGEHKHTRIL